jgi:hypothetical protein
VLTNQTDQDITTTLTLDDKHLPEIKSSPRDVRVWRENKQADGAKLADGKVTVTVAPRGITALAIDGVDVKPSFQQQIAPGGAPWAKDHVRFDLGKGSGMVLNMGPTLTSAYVYLEANGDVFKNVKLKYKAGGEEKAVDDASYPFEYTVPLTADAKAFEFAVEATTPDGATQTSEWFKLER